MRLERDAERKLEEREKKEAQRFKLPKTTGERDERRVLNKRYDNLHEKPYYLQIKK